MFQLFIQGTLSSMIIRQKRNLKPLVISKLSGDLARGLSAMCLVKDNQKYKHKY